MENVRKFIGLNMAVDIAMKILLHLKIFQLLELHGLTKLKNVQFAQIFYLPQHRQQVFNSIE
ncbi:MAG: hypothetical protein AAF349_14265 [Cyanobacteria bacterium P01_A01_bin.68]